MFLKLFFWSGAGCHKICSSIVILSDLQRFSIFFSIFFLINQRASIIENLILYSKQFLIYQNINRACISPLSISFIFCIKFCIIYLKLKKFLSKTYPSLSKDPWPCYRFISTIFSIKFWFFKIFFCKPENLFQLCFSIFISSLIHFLSFQSNSDHLFKTKFSFNTFNWRLEAPL